MNRVNNSMSEEIQKENNENETGNGVELGQIIKDNKSNNFFYTLLVVVILIATFYVVKNREKNVDPIAYQEDENSAVSETKDNDENINDNIKNEGNKVITINNIKSGDLIESPVLIKGVGISFENNLIVELRNNEHETLVKEFTTIKSAGVGEEGEYLITLHFQFRGTKEGYLAVYEFSAEDGSELNMIEIPVKFKTIE